VATAWSASQFTTLSALRGEAADLRNKVRAEVPAVEPIRRVAERRADRASVIGYLREASTERSSLTRALAASATAVPDGIRFDALHVGRSNAGWNVAIEGQVTGATSSQVVHSLDRFYQSIRSRPGITSPNLDRFEFPASNAEDSTHIARGDVGPLMLQFRVSYTILRFDTSAAESGAGGGPASGARR
jgi:hypothetical protein